VIEIVQVKQATCDGCGKVRTGDDDVEEVPGYSGTIQKHPSYGYVKPVEWFACAPRCVGKAANTVLARVQGDDGSIQGELLL
jgi:hypothetical protein